MAQLTIVLAHGIFGFGALPGLPSLVNYFNGVAEHLRAQGHIVFAPQVAPVGSVAARGDKLAAAILDVPLPEDEQLHVIAHSMGGLDARHALSLSKVEGVARRVKTLVTIGTPHRGSPVADAVDNPTHPLFDHIPAFLASMLKASTGAVHDLTTTAASEFDAIAIDAPDVRYIEVAGDASRANRELLFFDLAAAIGRLTGEVNDGIVARSSALRDVPTHEHLEDWPVDHAGEIGWSFESPIPFEFKFLQFTPPPHFARYDAIVQML